MKVGNIIYEKELVNHTQVEYINYINKPQEYNVIDKSLPTLYVGWVFMKSCNQNNDIIQNADILNKEIIENQLYWECSFDEGKSSHVNGVERFTQFAPKYYFAPKYSYYNVDPVFYKIKSIDEFLDVIPKRIDFSYNFKNEMFYLLADDSIFGVNLKMYEFFKIDINKLVTRIVERTNTQFTDLEGETYKKYYKILPNYQELKRYLIVMLSK